MDDPKRENLWTSGPQRRQEGEATVHRIVRIHKTGGPEVLTIEDLKDTPPAANEISIRVKALGLNRSESMFRSGRHIESAKFPARLGYEAAGTVCAMGRDVSGFAIGDAVSIIPPPSVTRWGAYGEVATVPFEFVVKHPDSLSWIQAAAVWMQSVTAYGTLIDIARIREGDSVIILAASSSVGLAAIQIANSVGAISIATTRTNAKKQALLDFGAKHVIATETEDLCARVNEITDGRGARIVLDPIGGPGIVTLVNAMAPQGILISYGMLSQEPTPYPLFTMVAKCLTLRGFTFKEIVSDPERLARAKQFILENLAAGRLLPIIDKTFAFDQIVDAHRYLESNQQFGKIVVTV